ncbi:MAG: hypothetical protein JWM96_384 [Alphaproteobacteria bacterium]|nr:hypothetical protein [Alphaproteobacteria bacterium]
MSLIENIFNSFEGEWNLERKVMPLANAMGDPLSTAQGKAVFKRVGDTQVLAYKEKDTHLLQDATEPLEFYRQYKYELTDDLIAVRFDDGPDKGAHYQSYFFNKEIRGSRKIDALVPYEVHRCGDDVYSAYYDIDSDNDFTLTTAVHGKEYLIKTRFTRQP